MSESAELAAKLAHRNAVNEGEAEQRAPQTVVNNVYIEFKEFTRKQIKDFEKMFKKFPSKKDCPLGAQPSRSPRASPRSPLSPCVEDTESELFEQYDADNNKYLDLMEMKVLMEKLGVPQTHIGLKSMIAEVDEDNDGVISFREFLLIFRKAQLGELEEGSGLLSLVRLSEIDVGEVGVKGAKSFFECKIKDQTDSNKFENEIKQEQEERRREEEEAKARKEAFKQKAANFDGL